MLTRFTKITPALAAGIVVGGLWGAVESLIHIMQYGSAHFNRMEFLKLTVNYSLHWALLLGVLAAVFGIFAPASARSRSAARGWPVRFWLYATLPLAGGAAIFLIYSLNAFWMTNRFSLQGILTNGGVVIGGTLCFWLLSRLMRRISRRTARIGAVSVTVVWIAAIAAGLLPMTARAGSAGGTEQAAGHNVLILLIDALRADHVGCYGYERPVTPVIDGIARESIRFENFIATSSWTRPTTASILTGTFPTSHDQNWLVSVLPPETLMMPDCFGGMGFETAFVSANPIVNRASGLAQVVDFYVGCGTMFNSSLGWCLFKADKVLHHIFKERRTFFFYLFRTVRDAGVDDGSLKKDGGWANDHFLEWLDDRENGKPFFGYIHYMDPHTPYDPRPPFDKMFRNPAYDGPELVEPPMTGRGMPPIEIGERLPEDQRLHLLNRYDGEIASVDAYVGDLCDALKERGLYDRTLLVILSDHGEGFYDHAAWTHGNSLFQELIHVPLIIRMPGGEHAGTVVSDLCSQMDLFPTILDYLGIEPYPILQGISLLPLVRRQGGLGDDHAVMSEMRFADKFYTSMIQNGMKVVKVTADKREETFLFDLSKDPGEKHSLDKENPWVLEEMLNRLEGWLESFEERKIDSQQRQIPDEDLEKLRALGYG